jgi:hypothetical protein
MSDFSEIERSVSCALNMPATLHDVPSANPPPVAANDG